MVREILTRRGNSSSRANGRFWPRAPIGEPEPNGRFRGIAAVGSTKLNGRKGSFTVNRSPALSGGSIADT